jgi:hypothetical protein
MTKTNIVPAVGTDDEVTRKNSTISSHYFGYGGGHLLKLWRCFSNVAKSDSFTSPGQGFYHFFKILILNKMGLVNRDAAQPLPKSRSIRDLF